MISDYMKHLKLHHNYSSLKMKYQQEEFPLLASPRQQSDGFGHMVEKEEEDEEQMPVTSEESNQLGSKNTRIAELTEAKARLEQLKR